VITTRTLRIRLPVLLADRLCRTKELSCEARPATQSWISSIYAQLRAIGDRRSCRLCPVLQASEPMQKVLQHLMHLLTNHLSSEDKAYLR